MADTYVYIWEYLVDPEHELAFRDAYGPNGLWVDLFRAHKGYIRTELARDRHDPQRYVTIDYWESEEAWQRFRERADQQFREIDEKCASFTTRERELGTFALLGGRHSA